MPSIINLDFSQPANTLTALADAERGKILPKNDFIKDADEYSVTNPDALADGDSMGRGTGVFLDVYNENGGTIDDITERKNEIKINKYNKGKTYPDF
jgi:hypothetical protein